MGWGHAIDRWMGGPPVERVLRSVLGNEFLDRTWTRAIGDATLQIDVNSSFDASISVHRGAALLWRDVIHNAPRDPEIDGESLILGAGLWTPRWIDPYDDDLLWFVLTARDGLEIAIVEAPAGGERRGQRTWRLGDPPLVFGLPPEGNRPPP